MGDQLQSYSLIKGGRRGSANISQQTKACTSAVESAAKQTASATAFYKKTSQATSFQTQKKVPTNRDIAILHESRIFRTLLEKASKKHEQEQKSPIRNPILQESDDFVQEFRPCMRRLASAEKMSECLDENFKRSKATGEFNYIFNPPPLDPKPQGIRAFVVLPSQSSDENPRRISKAVRSRSSLRRDPILEGDESAGIIRKSKKTATKTDHHQKLNELKFLLPAERGRSAQGRVFREMTFTLGEEGDFSSIGSCTERLNTQPSRPITAMEKKMRGSIKGVLEYEDGPKYRDQKITDKCNKIKFVDILKGQEVNERIFARKKTLDY